MTTAIVTRASKGSELTWSEVDANFNNLKTTADNASPLVVPHFDVYQSSAQTVASSTNTKVLLQTAVLDNFNYFDTVTDHSYNPKIAGMYFFNGHIWFDAAADTSIAIAYLYKNGSLYKAGTVSHGRTGKAIAVSVSCLVPMNGSTDKVSLYTYQDTDVGRGIAPGECTHFSGFFVSG